MTDERQLSDDVEGHEFKGNAAQQQTRIGRFIKSKDASSSSDDFAGHQLEPERIDEDSLDVDGHTLRGRVVGTDRSATTLPEDDVDGHIVEGI